MNAEEVREQVKEFLNKKQWSVSRLATAAGIPNYSLYRFMKGDGGLNMSTVEKLQPIIWPDQK